jgi:hypothetical protein
MIHMHVSFDPLRAETYLFRQRLWACATEPGEQLRDVLRHLAAQLVAAGVPPESRASIWPTGCKQRGPVRLARLLSSETARKAPPAASRVEVVR